MVGPEALAPAARTAAATLFAIPAISAFTMPTFGRTTGLGTMPTLGAMPALTMTALGAMAAIPASAMATAPVATPAAMIGVGRRCDMA